jgi:hypothetical protein
MPIYNPVIVNREEKLLRSQMKQLKVMERVYEPGRLHKAWQHVKKNAGAAGIDRMNFTQATLKS